MGGCQSHLIQYGQWWTVVQYECMIPNKETSLWQRTTTLWIVLVRDGSLSRSWLKMGWGQPKV